MAFPVLPRRIATVIGSEQIASQNRTLGGLPVSVNGVVSGRPENGVPTTGAAPA